MNVWVTLASQTLTLQWMKTEASHIDHIEKEWPTDLPQISLYSATLAAVLLSVMRFVSLYTLEKLERTQLANNSQVKVSNLAWLPHPQCYLHYATIAAHHPTVLLPKTTGVHPDQTHDAATVFQSSTTDDAIVIADKPRQTAEPRIQPFAPHRYTHDTTGLQ